MQFVLLHLGINSWICTCNCFGCKIYFAERADGEMTIRRGFEVKPGEKYLVCEDIITTGGSALEAAREIVKRWW